MTTDDEPTEGRTPEPTDEQLGVAVPLVPPSSGLPDERFAARVRRAIHRRMLGSSVVEFCLAAPLVVVLELATMIHSLFHNDNGERSQR